MTADDGQVARSKPGASFATMAMLQRYFDEFLLMKLVENGALTKEQAKEICIQTAVFAGEISEESDKAAIATVMAASFQQMSESIAKIAP